MVLISTTLGASIMPDTRDVSCGAQHCCAIQTNNQLTCWGDNTYGQLGIKNTDQKNLAGNYVDFGADRWPRAIATGHNHSCALLDDATVQCWGDNRHGQLGIGSTTAQDGSTLSTVPLGTGRKPTHMALGKNHSCALLEGELIQCWGQGDQGQLGTGSTHTVGDGPGEMGNAIAPVNLMTGGFWWK